MYRKEKIKNLLAVKKILDKHNIVFWLDDGQLLHAVRDNNPIMEGKDFDIGIFNEQIGELRLLFPEFAELNFEIKDIRFKDNIQLIQEGFKIDINVYVEKNGNRVRRYFYNRYNPLGVFLAFLIKWLSKIYLVFGCRITYVRVKKDFLENFDDLLFLDDIWRIPDNAESYLYNRYGANWRIPDKNYDFMKDNEWLKITK